MSTKSNSEHHTQLLDRMAARNGADLDMARQSGLIDGTDVVDAMVACIGCSDASDCASRLDRETPGLPGYCRNAELIARLEAMTA